MVTMGAEAGAIAGREREMIHRIFRFDDIDVEEVMTPRAEMKVLPSGTTLREIKDFLAETPYSRIPVYRGRVDNIVGIFYVKDAWDYLAEGKTGTRIETIMRPPLFVPKTKKIDKLLSQFQREHTHMAIVVGEYGGVLGLVTLEDLLEEIVGEIVDESDVVPEIRRTGKGTFEVSGRVSLEQLNRFLGTKWRSRDFDTISGFIIEKLDRLPRENEKIAAEKYNLVVTKVKQPKILRVKIVKRV
jgi:putative hemolysin